MLSSFQAIPGAGDLVEHTDTIRLFGPGVGGFLLLVLGVMLIKRKWPKSGGKAAEVGEYHTTLRGANTAAHATILALHADQQTTLRQAMTTIDRLATRDVTAPFTQPPPEPSGTQGGTP